MNKKFFRRAAAFAVALLMADGVINVLPDEYFPHIGAVVSAEGTDGVAVDSINFPDEIFRQYVSDNFDKDNNGLLSDEEISQATEIELNNCNLQSLKGIEYFSALTRLLCGGNQLASLDISNNTIIWELDCNNNQLTSLDVSNNTALAYLRCHGNKLTSLDVSNNTALIQLWCGVNPIASLDVYNNVALTDFSCYENPLTSLDVSNNTALTWLNCLNTQLTSLDVSNNTALTELQCGCNKITSLDVSNNIYLEKLLCYDNKLTSIDVSNNTALTVLSLGGNQFTSLDVSNNTALAELQCDGNKITSLDVSNNTALTLLYCHENQLTSLDVSNNTELTKLQCDKNFYNIGKTCGTYDLKNLPVCFDITKASNWRGAMLTGDKLTGINGTGNITYDYDCGNNHTATFYLTYDYAEHSYDEGVVTIEPTEQTEGEKTYTCAICGATKTEVIEKLEHVHNKGDELIADETGHWYACSGCDEKLDFAAHTEDNGTVTVEPTETTEGQKVYKCTVCDYTTRTEVVAKLDHIHNKGDELSSDETSHWYACSSCGEKLDFATHTEDNGTVTVEPTETAEGQRVYKCTVCSHTIRTEVIAKLEHVHNKGDELSSDETSHWYACSGCDEKLDFAAHTEDNGTVTVEPTVTTEGQKVYKCTVCGYTTRTEVVAKLEQGNPNPSIPSQPSNPSQPSQTQQPEEEKEPETNISVKKGWGNVVKEINKANDNSKINVDMGNSTNVPKNVMNAIKGKNVDILLDMGGGMTWTINGKDVTNPQSVDFSVTKKQNSIPQDMISDPSNTVPLVLAHNGNFGCSATLSIDLKGNDKKIANLYYYNTKTKELEFVDSSVIVNGKASLVFTHASDWAIVISDTSAEYEDVSSAAGIYETDDDSQTPLCIIAIILAALGFSYIIITKRLAKNKR